MKIKRKNVAVLGIAAAVAVCVSSCGGGGAKETFTELASVRIDSLDDVRNVIFTAGEVMQNPLLSLMAQTQLDSNIGMFFGKLDPTKPIVFTIFGDTRIEKSGDTEGAFMMFAESVAGMKFAFAVPTDIGKSELVTHMNAKKDGKYFVTVKDGEELYFRFVGKYAVYASDKHLLDRYARDLDERLEKTGLKANADVSVKLAKPFLRLYTGFMEMVVDSDHASFAMFEMALKYIDAIDTLEFGISVADSSLVFESAQKFDDAKNAPKIKPLSKDILKSIPDDAELFVARDFAHKSAFEKQMAETQQNMMAMFRMLDAGDNPIMQAFQLVGDEYDALGEAAFFTAKADTGRIALMMKSEAKTKEKEYTKNVVKILALLQDANAPVAAHGKNGIALDATEMPDNGELVHLLLGKQIVFGTMFSGGKKFNYLASHEFDAKEFAKNGSGKAMARVWKALPQYKKIEPASVANIPFLDYVKYYGEMIALQTHNEELAQTIEDLKLKNAPIILLGWHENDTSRTVVKIGVDDIRFIKSVLAPSPSFPF